MPCDPWLAAAYVGQSRGWGKPSSTSPCTSLVRRDRCRSIGGKLLFGGRARRGWGSEREHGTLDHLIGRLRPAPNFPAAEDRNGCAYYLYYHARCWRRAISAFSSSASCRTALPCSLTRLERATTSEGPLAKHHSGPDGLRIAIKLHPFSLLVQRRCTNSFRSVFRTPAIFRATPIGPAMPWSASLSAINNRRSLSLVSRLFRLNQMTRAL